VPALSARKPDAFFWQRHLSTLAIFDHVWRVVGAVSFDPEQFVSLSGEVFLPPKSAWHDRC
jgi:hypothetical protein